ncbi:hypothetical protein BP6252_10182 [Coleophoma cylindrospora]|uniref:Uncharacterized protein n=1 Tax=Coleophoma cylindrospora TaxID=1849047 RepID=A0A3D8QXN7_9HELO|nr:hypothetical protein BP6252_10182 [Coleophoma cylindrospora]
MQVWRTKAIRSKIANTFQIATNLPASEAAFEQGPEEKTGSMSEALHIGASNYSSFAGKVLVSYPLSRNLAHSYKSHPDDHPEDLQNGAYWKRSQESMDSLSIMLFFLPEHLRLPQRLHDQNAIFVNLNLHASSICLHWSAVNKIIEHDLSPELLVENKTDYFL